MREDFAISCAAYSRGSFSGTAASVILPEQGTISVRDSSLLAPMESGNSEAPVTVADPRQERTPRLIGLDDAIRVALGNSDVIRVLAGISATSSGTTIYDPAISNTVIDDRQAVFDPNVVLDNSFNRLENPSAAFIDPANPVLGSVIDGIRTDDYNLRFGLSKQTITGGSVRLDVNSSSTRFRPGIFPLDPRIPSSVEMSVTQPLLQGAGIDANLAPIVVARIDTERSFFQFKDSVQQMVRGVVEAYWALVFARTDEWARRQQVEQGAGIVRIRASQARTVGQHRRRCPDAAGTSQLSRQRYFRGGQCAAQRGRVAKYSRAFSFGRIRVGTDHSTFAEPAAIRLESDHDACRGTKA